MECESMCVQGGEIETKKKKMDGDIDMDGGWREGRIFFAPDGSI